MPKILPPVHPGEVLREEFMAPMGISINALARELHIPVSRVSKIVNEERNITPDTAMRAARYFGTSAEFWLNLQSRYDLLRAKSKEKVIRREVRPLASATTVVVVSAVLGMHPLIASLTSGQPHNAEQDYAESGFTGGSSPIGFSGGMTDQAAIDAWTMDPQNTPAHLRSASGDTMSNAGPSLARDQD